MKKNKILLLLAHPSKHRSEVNSPLYEYAKSLEFVTTVDLYGEYPTYNIDIDREQQRLNAHDIIIFQFPFYWYSTPSILKEWQDLVLEYGYAYGTNGDALHGKTLICALSAGGKEEAYRSEGYNHFTVRELLQPLEQTANLIGMNYLPPFTLFSSRSAVKENRLSDHLKQWQQLLDVLHHDQLPSSQSLNENITINDVLPTLSTSMKDE